MKEKYKYIHYVSYMGSENRMGTMEIFSNWKNIDTKSKMNDVLKFIKVDNPIVQNIITVKNK